MGSASGQAHLDFILYGVFPYIAFVLFIVVTVQRYRQSKFSYSSLSSQFLENRQHFWGMVPFHYGILFVLFGHFVAFLVPSSILWWNSHPARLYILEITAPCTHFGSWVLTRRWPSTRLRTTSAVLRGSMWTSDAF